MMVDKMGQCKHNYNKKENNLVVQTWIKRQIDAVLKQSNLHSAQI